MGAMKSMAYDYAIYLQRQAQDEDNLDFDIDEVFRQIVDGEIEIPQSYVDMWVSRNSVFASENVVFDAETNSWKQQKRDAKGRFIKGFSDKTEAQLNQEYDEKEEELQAYLEYANDEYIYNEMIAPYYQYGDLDQDKQMSANEFSDFLSQAIMNDNFPEKLTDIYYFQYLQKVAESVPLEILEKLHDIMEMQLNIGQVSGDKDIEILGGRGVFITDILLNLKQGQEMWSAETFESPATVNNFWANCHDGKFGVLGRKIYYNCRLFASISTGAAVVSNPVGFYADGRSKLRYSSRLSKSNSPEVEIVKSLSNKEQPSSVEDWYNLFDKANMELNKQFQAETEEIAYSDAEINLMRYDIVEHELENSDYNFLYDVLLYGTPGWANYTDEEVVLHFRNIFER